MKEKVYELLNIINSEGDFMSSSDFISDELLDSFNVIELVSMLESEFAWIVEHLGVDVPLHLSAFFPAYKATEIGSTPVETLFRAQSLAEKAGIRYVYLGNVPGMVNTKCPACGSVLIERHGYHTRICGMKDDKCASCGHAIAGVFVTSSPGRH